MQGKNIFGLLKVPLYYLKFYGDISTSFGKFDSLKYSLRNVKISQNQNFESRKTDKKKIFSCLF